VHWASVRECPLAPTPVRVVILAQGKVPPSRAVLPSPRRVIDVRADAVAADVEELRRDVDGDAACRALYP
jgi:riboflavin biosynthesis pyrimidine reductase